MLAANIVNTLTLIQKNQQKQNMKMVKHNLKMVKYHPSHHPPIQTHEQSNEHFACAHKNMNTIQ